MRDILKTVLNRAECRKSAQDDKWSICLTAGDAVSRANQERP